ncbi:hypothetical protein COOONC_13263 [Cooperia oncophora]
MSFIKTIFPATKRRKTDSNMFVQPQPPGERNGQQPRAAGGVGPPTPRDSVTSVVTKSPVFESFCTTRERELRPDMLRMVLIEAEQRVLFDTASVVPIGCRILPPNAQLSACKKFQINDCLLAACLLSHELAQEMRANAESLESSDSESQSQYITIRSMDSMNGINHSKPGCISSTAPPEAFKRVRNTSLHLDDDADEIRPFSPPTAARLSRDRRLQMSHKTSLCEQCMFFVLRHRAKGYLSET